MSATYHLALLTSTGVGLDELDKFSTMELTLVESDLSTLVLNLPTTIDPEIFQPEQVVLVFRTYAGKSTLIGDKAWFLGDIEDAVDGNGGHTSKVTFSDSNVLLDRRVLPYTQDTDFMIKDAFALDMMNQFVRESMGILACDENGVPDPLRQLEPDHLIIPDDNSLGPLLHIEAGNVSILSILQDIVRASAALGTYVGFEMKLVNRRNLKFMFRAYINQRGIDRRILGSSASATISQVGGNLREPVLIRSYRKMKSVAFVGGTGQGFEKTIIPVVNIRRYRLGPFARNEGYVNASNSDEDDLYLEQSGYEYLTEHGPSESFRAVISQTDAFQFIRDFDWGDIFNVRSHKRALTVRLWKLYIGVSRGEERIQGHLENIDVPND